MIINSKETGNNHISALYMLHIYSGAHLDIGWSIRSKVLLLQKNKVRKKLLQPIKQFARSHWRISIVLKTKHPRDQASSLNTSTLTRPESKHTERCGLIRENPTRYTHITAQHGFHCNPGIFGDRCYITFILNQRQIYIYIYILTGSTPHYWQYPMNVVSIKHFYSKYNVNKHYFT